MNIKVYFKSRVFIFFRPLLYIINIFKHISIILKFKSYAIKNKSINYFNEIKKSKNHATKNKLISVFNDNTIKKLKNQKYQKDNTNYPVRNLSYRISTVNVVSDTTLKVIRNNYA